MQWKLAIPSYGRSDTIAKHPLLERAHLVIPASQEAAYRAAVGDKPAAIVCHQDIIGVAKTRNFILDEVKAADDDFLFMCDDDLHLVRFLMSFRVINLPPARMLDVITHTARLAFDAGTTVFGYARTPRPMERTVLRPFSFRSTTTSGLT